MEVKYVFLFLLYIYCYFVFYEIFFASMFDVSLEFLITCKCNKTIYRPHEESNLRFHELLSYEDLMEHINALKLSPFIRLMMYLVIYIVFWLFAWIPTANKDFITIILGIIIIIMGITGIYQILYDLYLFHKQYKE